MIAAVRLGNLEQFSNVVKTHQEQFKRDRTFILIQRLRHNVIKTGLRAISASYSKISLQDIGKKLMLKGTEAEDVESIVAKVTYYYEFLFSRNLQSADAIVFECVFSGYS